MRVILLCVLIGLFSSVIAQKKVRGIVFIDKNYDGVYNNGEQTLSGVAISNQKDVVLTDSNGEYIIPLRDKAFVYLIKPTGYQLKQDSLNFPKFYYHHHSNGTSLDLKYLGVKPTEKAHQKVELSIDGGNPIIMKNYTGIDPFIEQTIQLRKNIDDWQPDLAETFHLWKVTLPRNIKKGTHKVEVFAYGEKGKIYKGYKIFELK